MSVITTVSSVCPLLRLLPALSARSRKLGFRCRSSFDSDQEYLVDAPESVGDGFSFSGGKYSDGPSRADEWLALGKTSMIECSRRTGVLMGRLNDPILVCIDTGQNDPILVQAHPVYGGKGKAKDPIFGLTLGAGSQSPGDVFRWFCVEAGSSSNSPIILVHGFPSQAYSYRKVITILSENYRAIAFDWLGFGFSDKPQPRYGFDYTLDEYVLAFESLVNALVPGKVSLVVQGYFCPVVLKYASCHQEKLSELILVNPPLMEKHAKLPSSLALFSNFLLGEIFSQDPLRASDKALTSCGPYMMKEEDAMVYRRPYLTSGSSGFALNAISKAMKRGLKDYVKAMRTTLSSEAWKISTTICWGMRDRWLSYDGVEEFCKASNHKLVELPMAGHHVQEDSGEELGRIISQILSKNK